MTGAQPERCSGADWVNLLDVCYKLVNIENKQTIPSLEVVVFSLLYGLRIPFYWLDVVLCMKSCDLRDPILISRVKGWNWHDLHWLHSN